MLSSSVRVPVGSLTEKYHSPTGFKICLVGLFYALFVNNLFRVVKNCKELFTLCGGYVVEVGFTLRLCHGNG
jgi:hypothetical protein